MKKPTRFILFTFVLLLAVLAGVLFRTPEEDGRGDSDVRNVKRAQIMVRDDERVAESVDHPEIQSGEKPVSKETDASLSPVAPVAAFSQSTAALVEAIEQGRQVGVKIGNSEQRYLFRPRRITAENFKLSMGLNTGMPAEFRVYEGRQILEGRLGESASMAVVNDQVAMAYEDETGKYMISDNGQGRLVARKLRGAMPEPGHDPLTCTEDHDHGVANMLDPNPWGPTEDIPVEITATETGDTSGDGGPTQGDNWVDHNFFRLAPEYDASLVDLTELWVSAKSQTGNSSNLSSRAAEYFTFFARHADTYERQLGYRTLLQELILIPSDSPDEDPGPTGTSSDLSTFRSWLSNHRSPSSYEWGHAACWMVVDGSGGGVIGRAYLNNYGDATYGTSVNERSYDWDVYNHEMGHNVGCSHSSGGIMNSTLTNNNEDFYREVSEGAPSSGITAAMDSYTYMSSDSGALGNQYGPATLRHPEEIPFAIDDAVSTAADTPVVISPLSNDHTSVMFGAVNTLTLVEAGAVYPPSAGTALVNGSNILFTPASGYTGQAWFTYTIRGNQGNGGAGWLHAADVVVTVGGDSSAPSLTPSLEVNDDDVVSNLTANVRVNPLLNDFATGRLHAGNVDALSSINGAAQAYSDGALFLTGATLLQGNGTVMLDTRPVTDNGSATSAYSGYVEYDPQGNESTVIIQYSVQDAYGNTGTALITIGPATAPVITSQPVGGEALGGVPFQLEVEATGIPAPSYQWKKDGVDIAGGITSWLTLGDPSASDAGTYTVVVSNSAGSVTSNPAVVTVNDNPEIVLVSPSSTAVDVEAGGSLSLDTTVTDDGNGGGGLTTTWSVAGGPGSVVWGDASSPDTLVTFSANGVYVLRLTADDGSATSTLDLTVSVGGIDYLVNLGGSGYTLDPAGRVWQSYNPTDLSTFGASGDPLTVSGTLNDTGGGTAAGIGFSTTIQTGGGGTVSLNNSVTASRFIADPFDWFTPTEGPQREVVTIAPGSQQTFTFSGFETDERVQVAWVFGRDQTGDRAVTVTHQSAGDVLNDAQVDEDGSPAGPQYPQTGLLTGSTSYSFQIHASGSGWGCLPNALRLRVYPTQSVQFETPDSTAGEADGTVTLTVRRTGGSSGAASVNWSTADGSALAGSDYTAASGTLNWADGDSADKTVEITLLDDGDYDPGESFQVTLDTPSGLVLGSASAATVTITDNESPPPGTEIRYYLNFGETAYTTDGTNTWQTFDLTAQDGIGVNADPVSIAATTLQDASGSSAAGVTVAIPPASIPNQESVVHAAAEALDFTGNPFGWFDPSVAAQRETFAFKGTQNSASWTYVFDGFSAADTVTFQFVVRRASGSNVRTITLVGPSSTTLIDNGEIDEAPQFVSQEVTGSSSYTFVVTNTSAEWVATANAIAVTVVPSGPSVPAAPSGLSAAAVSSSQIDLSWTDNSGDETGFKVQRSGTSGGPWSTLTTTAADAASYSDTGLSPGSEYFYRVMATNAEGDSPPTAEASATTPTPNPGTLVFSSNTAYAAENAGTVTLTVQRTLGSDGAVTVSYASADGTALAGSGYTAVAGSLDWADGETADKTITLTLLNDSQVEAGENVIVSLGETFGGAVPGTPSEVTVTITDDDNTAPAAGDDSVSTPYLTAVSPDVLANDTDTDGHGLVISSVTQGANGTVTFMDTTLTYTPASGFSGTDSFTYSVVDGYGGGDTATVTVTVGPAVTSTFLVNFGDESTYTTDGTNTWQSFDLSSSTGTANAGNLVAVNGVTLTDTSNNTAKGVTLTVAPNATADGKIGNQNEQVLESFFGTNPFSWFSPASAEQRKTHSINVGSGDFVFTLGGFSADDVVDVDFVLARSGTGDRAVTITRASSGDVLGDAQVGEDGGPQYPSDTGLTGSTSYTFTISNTGDGWACLPNAIRVHVTHAEPAADLTVAITSPTDGATIYPDELLTVSVNASAVDTTVSQVELFEGGVSVGTDSTAPYSFVRGYPSEGNLTLRAEVTGGDGSTAFHEVSVTVAPVMDRAWTRHTLDDTLTGADGVRSADVDGDGDEDLIVSWEESGTVRIYENPGASRTALTSAWSYVSFSSGLSNVEDAGLADLDGDGRLDFVAATENGNKNLVVYWAPGSGSDYWNQANWTQMTLTPASGQEWMFSRVMDVDGDGRPDIVAGSKNAGATVSWIKAPADPRVAGSWVKYSMTSAGWIMSLELEDMDGDGDTDVLISDRRAGGAAQAVRWLEHPGTGSPNLTSTWTSHTIAGAGEEVMFLDVADLDGDGLRDIVVPILEEGATPNDWLLIRRLDATGLNWSVTRRTFGSGTGEGKTLKVLDVNGDGQLDLVAAFGDAISPTIGGVWLEHDGDPVAGTWTEHPVTGSVGEKFDRIVPLDLDGDGDLDLVQTDEDENKDSTGLGLVVYENPTVKDSDGDGATDQEEFGMGSNPQEPTSVLEITGMQIGPGGEITLIWNSDQTGSENPQSVTYRVVYTDELTGTPVVWTPLGSGIPSAGSTTQIQDASPGGARFYRVEVE
jgi:hypothetical protein